jgi:hypothetical protein
MNSECTIGRDSAKKLKATELIVDKVIEGIVRALWPSTPQTVDSFRTQKKYYPGLVRLSRQ